MARYEVQIDAPATVFVEVEAEDEDEAHDLAKDEARAVMQSDWEIETRDCLVVMGVRELSDDE